MLQFGITPIFPTLRDSDRFCLSNAMHSNIGQSIKSPECPRVRPCVQLFLSSLPSTFPFLFLSLFPFLSTSPFPFSSHSHYLPFPSLFSFPFPSFSPSTFPFLFLPLPFSPSSFFLSVSTSVRPTFEAPYLHNGTR